MDSDKEGTVLWFGRTVKHYTSRMEWFHLSCSIKNIFALGLCAVMEEAYSAVSDPDLTAMKARAH